MATRRIAGITIELNADTKDFVKGIRGLDKELKTTQDNLKDINKLLKLDPGNTELLTQKQKNLKKAIEDTKERLQQLKTAQTKNLSPEEYDKLQREIIDTQQQLKGLEGEYKSFGSVAKQKVLVVGQQIADVTGKVAKMGAIVGGTAIAGFAATMTAAASAAKALGDAIDAAAKKGFELAKSAGAYADNILTQSKVTGLSTDELQRWGLVSQLIDVDTDVMTGSMTKMEKAMGSAAKGSKSDAEKFAALGVSIKDSNGHLRDARTVYYEAIDALGKVENETERDALAMDLFGKSAKELNPLIEAGSDELRNASREADRLGGVIDKKTLDSLGEFDDSMQKMGYAAEGLRTVIGSKLTPIFKPLVDAATEAAALISRILQSNGPHKARRIADGLTKIVSKAIDDLGKTIQKYVPKIVTVIETMVKTIGAALPHLLQSLMPIIETALTGLADVVRDLAPVVAGALPGLVSAVLPSLLSAAGSLFMGLIDALPSIFEAVKNAVGALFQTIGEKIQQDNPELYNAIMVVKDAFVTAFEAVKQFWTDTLQPVLTEIWQFITETVVPPIIQAWDDFSAGIQTVFGAVKQFWDETLYPVFQAIYDYVYTDLIPTLIVAWEYDLQPAIEGVFNAISGFWENILKPAFQAIYTFTVQTLLPILKKGWDAIGNVFSGVFDTFGQLWDTVYKPYFEGIYKFVTDVFAGNWSEAWTDVVDTFGKVFAGIADLMKKPINKIIEGINWMIDKIQSGINTVIDGINSHVKIHIAPIDIFGARVFNGLDWGANLKRVDWQHIDYLASGGSLGEGQRAIVGEYAPEYLRVVNGRAVVTPMGGAQDGQRMGETNNYTFNVYAQPGQSAEQIAAAVQRVLVRQEKQRSAAYA